MSKESAAGDKCICGQQFAFITYHWPHCHMNPNNLGAKKKTEMERVFSKGELAYIAQHGGQIQDQQIAKRRGQRKAKAKR